MGIKNYFNVTACLHILLLCNYFSQVKCTYSSPLLMPMPPPSPSFQSPYPSFPSRSPLSDTPSPEDGHNVTSRLDSSAELVLGTFGQDMLDSWFYETYYPVILKVPIPGWSQSSIRLNDSSERCSTDGTDPNPLCPTQFHVESMLLRMSQNNRFYKNIYMSNIFSGEIKDEDIFDKNIHCLRIRPHFFHFVTTLKGIQPYIEELKRKCLLAKDISLIERDLSLFSSAEESQYAARVGYETFVRLHTAHFEKMKFHKLIHSYIEKKLSSNDTSNNTTDNSPHTSEPIEYPQSEKEFDQKNWNFIHMAAETAFQNALTIATQADSVRWANAYSSCQASRLDITLIPPDILINLLEEVSQNISRLGLGYNLSIPIDKLITHYYKLPLTDCTLAIESATEAYLILRLLVPVTQVYREYSLVRLNKVPFLIRSNKTLNDVGSICEIKNYQYDDMFIVEYDTSTKYRGAAKIVSSIIKAPPTCAPYHVCRIPDVVHRSLVDPCVEGILTKNEHMTKEKCDFKCFTIRKRQAEAEFPYIIPLTSNRFAVVGAMPSEMKGENITIRCYKLMDIAMVKQDRTDEATIVMLPCACEIIYGGKSYSPQKPCNNTLEIIHVTHILGEEKDNKGFKRLYEFDAEKTSGVDVLQNGKYKDKDEKPKTAPKPEPQITIIQNPKKQSRNGSAKANKTENDEIHYIGNEDQDYLSDYDLFKSPLSSNMVEESEPIVMVDASGSECYHATHIIIWVVGCLLLISNLLVLRLLYRQGFYSIDSIFLTTPR